ncbi:MAG: general secretion pathway protein GspH [Oscillatoriales cyanobacterium]|uniref:Type IV pilin-like G/H family protein n=1 Tax=Microcoleus anatoxicus PTRS2 TaxID=2705321 RepID=A0ABU8YVG7_9CYAN|nr:MAG: general secretion pathway protein GspH [Oscillatoriales cyanobacterium]TAE00668.1 MAG: general secretion pathway protein GspH [Oscillatoriales cyanobacterium]
MSNKSYNSIRNSPIYNGCGCLVIFVFYGLAIAGLISSLFFSGSSPQKAKQSEAKQYVDSINKAQQAYFAEESVFRTSVEALGLGLKTETANYKYSLRATQKAVFNYGVSKQKELKSYVGGVFVVSVKDGSSTRRILCQADSPGTIKPAEPTYENGEVVCGKGTIEVTK